MGLYCIANTFYYNLQNSTRENPEESEHLHRPSNPRNFFGRQPMNELEFKPLLAVAEGYIHRDCSEIAPETVAYLKQIIDHFLAGVIGFDRASNLMSEKVGTARPLERISAILGVSDSPIEPQQETTLIPPHLSGPAPRKNHPWSEYEDQRLLCGIHKYGLENWTAVSSFVGNFRSRAQCSQRWLRGLDPRISKLFWTCDEETKLVELVRKYGDRAWTKISGELGNRSDAQCRYHYTQMTKDRPRNGRHAHFSALRIPSCESGPLPAIPIEMKGIKTSLSGKLVLPPIEVIMGEIKGSGLAGVSNFQLKK
jgi:hypothetical protein